HSRTQYLDIDAARLLAPEPLPDGHVSGIPFRRKHSSFLDRSCMYQVVSRFDHLRSGAVSSSVLSELSAAVELHTETHVASRTGSQSKAFLLYHRQCWLYFK